MPSKSTYRRFDAIFILQHIVLLVCVLALIVSGIPLKFPESALSQWAVRVQGGMEMRALIHHVAAWVLIGLMVFHVVYYLFIVRSPPFYKRPIMPHPKDLLEIFHYFGFLLGLREKMPQMGRYTWYEKLEYLGLAWGFIVMCVTGLAMLFMNQALAFIPLSWLQTLWVAHSGEGLLATLFILIVHMYHVHFSPDRFPMSLTWLTGRISRKEMEKYHPQELREIDPETNQPRRR